MKKTYIKRNFKYWTAKKLNKHSMKIWYFVAVCMALVTVWAVINRQVNSGELVSPLVTNVVSPVYAKEELRKESTKAWKVYQWIRKVESTYGTQGLAVTCAKKGKFNEVGFRALQGYCFNNERDQETTLMQYIESKLNNGWTEDEVKCFYNGFGKVDGCYYSREDLINSK